MKLSWIARWADAERLGLKQVDGLIVSHMHGDHVLEGPHLRKSGVRHLGVDRMQDRSASGKVRLRSPVQTYGKASIRCTWIAV
jgi:glyoxylase-like metal-dependent hydrolase (beta-lactamase superfamily II)